MFLQRQSQQKIRSCLAHPEQETPKKCPTPWGWWSCYSEDDLNGTHCQLCGQLHWWSVQGFCLIKYSNPQAWAEGVADLPWEVHQEGHSQLHVIDKGLGGGKQGSVLENQEPVGGQVSVRGYWWNHWCPWEANVCCSRWTSRRRVSGKALPHWPGQHGTNQLLQLAAVLQLRLVQPLGQRPQLRVGKTIQHWRSILLYQRWKKSEGALSKSDSLSVPLPRPQSGCWTRSIFLSHRRQIDLRGQENIHQMCSQEGWVRCLLPSSLASQANIDKIGNLVGCCILPLRKFPACSSVHPTIGRWQRGNWGCQGNLRSPNTVNRLGHYQVKLQGVEEEHHKAWGEIAFETGLGNCQWSARKSNHSQIFQEIGRHIGKKSWIQFNGWYWGCAVWQACWGCERVILGPRCHCHFSCAPITSVDCERAFSRFNDILFNKRTNLTEKHLRDQMIVQWNRNLI